MANQCQKESSADRIRLSIPAGKQQTYRLEWAGSETGATARHGTLDWSATVIGHDHHTFDLEVSAELCRRGTDVPCIVILHQEVTRSRSFQGTFDPAVDNCVHQAAAAAAAKGGRSLVQGDADETSVIPEIEAVTFEFSNVFSWFAAKEIVLTVVRHRPCGAGIPMLPALQALVPIPHAHAGAREGWLQPLSPTLNLMPELQALAIKGDDAEALKFVVRLEARLAAAETTFPVLGVAEFADKSRAAWMKALQEQVKVLRSLCQASVALNTSNPQVSEGNLASKKSLQEKSAAAITEDKAGASPVAEEEPVVQKEKTGTRPDGSINKDPPQDGGVVTTEIQAGTSRKTPRDGDEVGMAFTCSAEDGTILEERYAFDYIIGSGACGTLSKVLDKALKAIKEGDTVQFTCTHDYACGDKRLEGAIIELLLRRVYEVKDVSFTKDKTLMKKQITEGGGHATPSDASRVKLRVSEFFPSSPAVYNSKHLDFVAGNGEVCDALECAVCEMKIGEKAILTCTAPKQYYDDQLGLNKTDANAEIVVLILELLEFEGGKDPRDMSVEEQVEFGKLRKEVGSNLFRNGRIMLALRCYQNVVDIFKYFNAYTEEFKNMTRDLRNSSELNSASCYLKLKNYEEARSCCKTVLKDDCRNVKALYRHAQANVGLNNFMESMADLKKLLAIDPQNRQARSLFKEAQVGQKEQDKTAKGMFSNMCDGLGKGPIPAPLQMKKIVPEDE